MNIEDTDESFVKYYEPRLNQEWVQVLINLRMKYSNLFTRKKNSASSAWRIIFQEIQETGSPSNITLQKIKKKWMNLVARYKLLKFGKNKGKITWPFYEQLDRACTKNPSILETRCLIKNDCGSPTGNNVDLNESILKKQTFVRALINLRHTYKELFTGKKFAARNGWATIRKELPNGNEYTIEQLGKCWKNLLQRYKTLVEAEKDPSKITWVYFKQMNELSSKNNEAKTVAEEIKTECEKEESNESSMEITDVGSCLEINLKEERPSNKQLTRMISSLEKNNSIIYANGVNLKSLLKDITVIRNRCSISGKTLNTLKESCLRIEANSKENIEILTQVLNEIN